MGRRTLVLVIAVALAGISGWAVWQYLSSVEETAHQEIQEVGVFRASSEIPAGMPGEEARSFINSGVALRNQIVFPNSQILCTGAVGVNAGEDPNEFGCTQNPSDLELVLDGKIASGPIAVGQLITTRSFALTNDLTQKLSDEIASGKVAISLSVDTSTASGGFIRPGDHVNILASASLSPLSFLEIISNNELRDLLVQAGAVEPLDDGTETPPTEGGVTTTTQPENLASAVPTSFDLTQTVLQNVSVLAVGEDTRPAPLATGLQPLAGVVVFEVTPQEAEMIEYVRQYSSVSLSLLPRGADYVRYDAQPVVVDDLFGLLDRISSELGLVTSGP